MARLYISGPVTGKPDDNYEAFDDASFIFAEPDTRQPFRTISSCLT